MNGEQVSYRMTILYETVSWARGFGPACRKVRLAYLATMVSPRPPFAGWGRSQRYEALACLSERKSGETQGSHVRNPW